MKTHRALAVYAFAALLCSFLVVRCLFSAPLLKADDTIVLTTTDLPQGYRLVADTGFQTREMALVTGTGEKEEHQSYTVHERRQDVALPSQADADGARISVTMMVFPSVELAMAYCEQMEVYVFEGGTLRLDPRWHTSRNDLGNSRLAGKGGAVRSDPVTLLIRYGNVFCQISAGSFNPKCSEAVGLLGKVWLEKVSRAPAGTAAVEEGSTKPDVTGAPKGTAPTPVAGTGAKDASGFYIVDLSPYASYGGRKGTPRQVKGVMIDDSSHIRIEPAGMKLLSFDIKLPQPVSASSVAVVSLLGHAHYLPNDFIIATLTVYTDSGSHKFEFKAGIHTSEWNRNESGGAAHRWPKETYLDAHNGQNRWMAVFQLPHESTVTGLRFDYADKDIDRKYYHVGNPPVFALLGITLIGRQAEKPEGYHLSEGKPQSATGGVPAGSGQAVVIDETGSVTQAQISKLQDGLAQLRDKYGVSIAIVFTGFLNKEAQKERSKEYYMRLRREGKLVDPAAVCLLWAGEGRTGINWHRDETVDNLLPWEKVEKAWDNAANSKPPGAPLALELIAQLLATPTPAGGEAKVYHLSGGDSSVPLNARYQPADGFLRLELRFSKPGSVLDTVGINPAKAGDFAIWILPDNVLLWQIYHPGIASNVRASNGWHFLRSQGSLQPERWYSVEVTWGKRGARLVIDGKVHAQVDVNLPLSGSEVFLGDFPGDAQWAPRYEVNRSFTGDVRNIVFGP